MKPTDQFEIAQITDAILEKYNRPGPRYTSYPTAPVWKDDFGPDDLESFYARAEKEATPLSLYMHIPFCESLCLFCACNVSIQKDKNVAIPYLDALKREIEHVSQRVSKNRPVIQFHWGGGTPTYLTPAQMEDLFGHARQRFSFAPDAEIGIEIDPRVTNRAHLETLRRLGFNRLSMGIQDFQPKVQETIHRVQPYEMTRDLIVAARELGFESLNVDLIYGLPYQTAESFKGTIDKTLTLAPDRVAMFSYAHVPWLKKQQGSFAEHLPEGMEKFRIFRAGLERFLGAGYLYIGMDHFARPGDELAVAQNKSHAAPQFSGLHHQGRRRPLRHGRQRDQLDRRGLRAESPRSSGVSGDDRHARHRHHARLPPFRRRPAAPRRDRPPALPHRDPKTRNRARIFHSLRRIFRAGTRSAWKKRATKAWWSSTPRKFASLRSAAFSSATSPWSSTAICTSSKWTTSRCSRRRSEVPHS